MRPKNFQYRYNIYSKSISQIDKEILNSKCLIRSILETFIKIKIKSYKILKSFNGIKILIKGFKIIKIHYVSNLRDSPVRSKTIIKPLYVIIPLPDCAKVCNIFAKVDCCEVDICNCKKIYIFTSIRIFIKVIEKNIKKPYNKYNNEIPRNIKKSSDKYNYEIQRGAKKTEKNMWNMKNDNLY